ncbi:MAG: efflux RND transporter periplasmic adaptor subunit [Gemmatimonadota bacterium]|nr:efflux RND transporter periplasmic adaptor subunit [Gemmatimonadota bacterium]
MRKLIIVATLALGSACASKDQKAISVSSVPVTRRDIIIDAQATGVVEPIFVVEVKSKAGGQIVKLPVETGTIVKPGDLLVQIETRDVQNQYDQVAAQLDAARSKLDVSTAQKKRADELFKSRIITATEHEAAQIDFANAQSQLVSARTSLDLRKQSLEDATVRAPVAGTIIERTVALGTVITSATGAFGGGTTLLKMADLSKVRIRALFNETDIGQVRPGQTATVTVDAYPDRRFVGTVEKIEPQAVIQQNVTMFPVLVTLDNNEGLLKPGMNGETNVMVEQRTAVLSVPNDAVRNPREAAATAPMLGLNPDSVRTQLAAQMAARGGGRQGGGNGGAGGPGGQGGAQQGGQGGARTGAAHGEVALDPQQQGGGQGQGGFQQIEVTDAQCKAVTAAFAKKPAEKMKLDDMRAQMMAGTMDRQAMRGESDKIYAAVGVDSRVAGACRRKEMQANGGGQGGAPGGAPGAAPGGARGGNAQSAAGQAGARGNGGNGGRMAAGGAGAPGLNIGGGESAATGARRTRAGLVFVKKGATFEPRLVQLGASNFDYTEVVSGVKEGEEVALLAAAALQAQRQQQNDRMKANSGVPGMQQAPAGGARGGGGGGRGG